MNTSHVKYLLVGGGLASSAAAEAIRQRDSAGSILLVSMEVNRPYHRPSLSHEYLRGEKKRAELSTFPQSWCAEHHVELRTGRRVVTLDTARSSVGLDDGSEVSYDAMLLAVGATPKLLKIPGAQLPNVFYLRTLGDADRLHNAVEKALREGRRHPRGVGRGRVAVIGGGLLGVELAGTLTSLGLHVDQVVGEAHPWFRIAGETTGALLAKHLAQHGVTVHLGSRAQQLDGDGRVQRVVLANGETIECDFAVAATGVLANREILRNTPIAAETAILVDPHCRSSVPNVFAAGDCAAVFDPLFGKHRMIDHWENAMITGAVAGTNMTVSCGVAGEREIYDAVNHYTSEVFGLRLSVWGERRQVQHRHVRAAAISALHEGPIATTTDETRCVEFGIAVDGRVAQVIKVGGGGESPHVLSQFVANRLQVHGREKQLIDPAIDLSSMLDGEK